MAERPIKLSKLAPVVKREPRPAITVVNDFKSDDIELGTVVCVQGLSTSGLGNLADVYYLYVRSQMVAQMEFMRTHPLSLIHGPPGSGKSVVTWLYALWCCKNHQFKVQWIHYDHLSETPLVSTVITQDEIRRQQDLDFLDDVQLLVLDGIYSGRQDVIGKGIDWCEKHEDRHVVFVTSEQLTTFHEEIKARDIAEFTVLSWTLDDYMNAVKHDKIRAQVYRQIGASLETPDWEELMSEKYFFAGGSCRFMFYCTESEVIKRIRDAIDRCSRVKDWMNGLAGSRGPPAVNTLLQLLSDGSCLLSAYVTRSLARICSASFVRQARHMSTNVAFDGWVLEMDFLMQIQWEGGVSLSQRHEEVPEEGSPPLPPLLWNKIHSTSFFNTEELVNLKVDQSQWLLPERWNQGGFDAVRVELIQLEPAQINIDFVQVTRAGTHSFKAKFMNQVVEALRPRQTINRIRFFFVVPVEFLETFTVPAVEAIWADKISVLGFVRS